MKELKGILKEMNLDLSESLGWQLFDSVLDVVEFLVFLFEIAFNVIDGQFLSVDQTFNGWCLLEESDCHNQKHQTAHCENLWNYSVVSCVDWIWAWSVAVWRVDQGFVIVFVIISVIIGEILQWEAWILLKVGPWVRSVRVFQFIMGVLDSLNAGESPVGFILDPGGISINIDGVIVVIVMGRSEHEDGWVVIQDSPEFKLSGDDFGQHKYYVFDFYLIFMINAIDILVSD